MSTNRVFRKCGMLLLVWAAAGIALLAIPESARAQSPPTCTSANTKTANVVAFDQPFMWNRLGAAQPQGMIYALRRDVVPISGSTLSAGNVRLRADKRPRPIVLRMNVGDCLQISFQNFLNPTPEDEEQPATRTASVRAIGLQLVGSIASDGSNVGQNASSLVAPGGTRTYTFYAEREGSHMLYSGAAIAGGEGDGGSIPPGLFGSVNVQPRNAEWYRSQVTAADLILACQKDGAGNCIRTAQGHPILNYNAVYPAGHPRAGLPILRMTQGNEIVHTDLRGIITGPNAGRFPAGTFPPNPTEPDREQPFREFTILYHDEIGAVQAFPQFEDPVLEHTLHSVRDAFAINYGTGGIGAEILANRFRVGPMHACTECKYEEFFLSAWTVSDPAQVVDVPANAPCQPEDIDEDDPANDPDDPEPVPQNDNCTPTPGPKATKVLFPDDPSNVYGAYIRDHVKFRILHAGPKEHHIHHQHTHQWLHTPDSDNASYLDSQALGPGASFTLEMVHNGSGNRNQAVGDSIFHCHFYPHFAQGMWAMWRVHDVFEAGTPLDAQGRPATGTRALPDGEIARGTPIPAIVPLPTIAMAPMPQAQVSIVTVAGRPGGQVQVTGTGNPGYPFFVPGVAGHRAPHPPLDTIDDGGLPRHIITGGTFVEVHNRLDFSKELLTANAFQLPENGTTVEVRAMNYHDQRLHPSFTPAGAPANFITNGLPPKPGAPFADPCISDTGAAIGTPRLYKGADIQLDLKLNKAGWHFPQQRISALWGDVQDTLSGARPPEPLFFRANTNDCITFHLTTLIPGVYELDDFQVRTPTDVMGQHIHLVKFDVTASDGSGNGWNYEDGSFTPDEVRERIEAINAFGGLIPTGGGPRIQLAPEPHPFFGGGPNGAWMGAQTTVQRWFADNVLNNAGQDRTLRTVFTHDHFGPSTHQQAGLYAGLVIEPQGSQWRHPETGVFFGSRFDGGPTSFRADIITGPGGANSYREFLIEFADFQLAYFEGGGVNGAGHPIPDPPNAVNPPGREEVGLPFLLERPDECPGGVPPPCPEAISADDPGTFSVNYRNEPVALRVRNPANNQQATGLAGNLSHVFRSTINRADPDFNVQPNFYPPLTGGIQPRDPFTPLLRLYNGDQVQIRILVGAHEEGHNFTVHGIKWLFEPSERNSGFRNGQMMGISEHFEFISPVVAGINQIAPFADFLYQAGASVDNLWNGTWGIMRAYNESQANLLPLPNGFTSIPPIVNLADFNQRIPCPNAAPVRNFDVTARTAQQALPGGKLIYNPRAGAANNGPLNDPTAVIFFRTSDLSNGTLIPGRPIEPLILRANAGDCIQLTLRNDLPATMPDLDGFNTLPMIVDNFNANQIRPSNHVGLHSQLLIYDVTDSDGANVGSNDPQTVAPGGTRTYRWYAGDLSYDRNTDRIVATPIEFGATNLISSDPIKHSNKGAIGALIIEPQGATWTEDASSRASATVTPPGGPSFRDFVLLFQNDINMRFGNGTAIPNLAEAEDPEDSGQKAFNYKSEPFWFRMGFAPDAPLTFTRTLNFTNVLANAQVGGNPVTPIFTAQRGVPVRFRVLHPQGHPRNNVFQTHGHIWEEEPWINNSTRIGSNVFSEWKGAEMGMGPAYHFNAIPKNGAGGAFRITGDYLYRTQASFQFSGGLWGIFRVTL